MAEAQKIYPKYWLVTEWLFLHKLLSQHKWSLRKNLSTEKISIHSGSFEIFRKKSEKKFCTKIFENKNLKKKFGESGCETSLLTALLTFLNPNVDFLSSFLTFIDFFWPRIDPFFDFSADNFHDFFSRAVGWEGFFGAIMLSILLVPFYYIILPPAFCADAVEPALNGSCRLEGLYANSSEKYPS